MEPRSAFARAEGFLDFSSSWKYLARLAAVVAALVTLGWFVVLSLIIDLVIYRGRVPEFPELPDAAKQEYARQWQGLSSERREQLLQAVRPTAEARKQIDTTGLATSGVGREWVWRAQVVHLLETRISPAAAEVYRLGVAASDTPESPPMGLASLAIRQPGWLQSSLSWIASWNPWTWRPSGGTGPNYAYLFGLSILAVVLAVVRAVTLNLMNYAAATATLDAATRLRRAIYHQSYRLGTLALRDGAADETAEIFAGSVEQVHDGLYSRVTHLFFQPLSLALLAVFALALNPWVALACLLFGAVVVLVGGYLAARFRDRARGDGRRAANQLGLLRESLASMRLVKSNLMELFNQSRVERQLADYSVATFSRFRNDSLFAPLLVFLATVSIAMALFLAGWAVLSGTTGPARMIVLAAVLAAMYRPISGIFEQRRVLKKARAAAVGIFEFLDRPGEVGQVVGAEFLAGVTRGIEFRGVSLREPGTGRLLLKDVNLKIKPGQRVAIVGPDEAEKRAIVYLLLRFLDANTGEVRIDDKSLKWLTLESLRAQIGGVMMDSLVFSDTVAHNIGCGEASVTMPQIIECAKLAHVHQFVQKLPHGYETPIGDMGIKLRRSEQFRIALARATLKDPSVFVIEEPEEPFDDATKSLIDDTLARVLPGKTVIYLAHRISTIRSCDMVYLIHRGQVEAAGEHRELIARSDLYKHLHYMEFNEFAQA